MPPPGNKFCPVCAKAIPSKSPCCINCGKDFEDLYLIVMDSVTKYAVSWKGEVKIHGLTLQEAQKVAALLIA